MSEFYGHIPNCDCSYCESEHKREAADKEAAERAAAETKEEHPVPTSRLLTLEMVLKGSPCYEYRNRFIERYGESGVEVTVEKALSESDDWDWDWAGAILLSRKAKAEFSRRCREADKAYDDAMKPYRGLADAAYDRYSEVRRTAFQTDEYQSPNWRDRLNYLNKVADGILEIPDAAYRAADEIARKRRRDATITAFAELFILDDEPFVSPYYDSDDEDDYYDED